MKSDPWTFCNLPKVSELELRPSESLCDSLHLNFNRSLAIFLQHLQKYYVKLLKNQINNGSRNL